MTMAQALNGPPVHDPMGRAFFQYEASLSPKERQFYRRTATTAEDLELEVAMLQTSHKKLSKTLKIATCIEPLVSFLKRHSDSVDTFVQANPFPAALVWGSIKVLLNLASYHFHYFESLVRMLQQLGDDLEIFRKYEDILKKSIPVQEILATVYYDIFMFLHKAKQVFAKRGSLLFARTLWKSFQGDFGNTIESFKRNKTILEDRIGVHNTENLENIGAIVREAVDRPIEQNISISNKNTSIQNYNIMKIDQLVVGAPAVASPAEYRRNVMNWVSNSDPGTDFTRESKRRVKLSGQWLLKEQIYQDWLLSSGDRLLRVIGCPGSGKTVLSTTIIENLQRQFPNIQTQSNHIPVPSCTAYFYCSKSTDQSQVTTVILGGLIKQILSQLKELPKCVTQCYEKSCAAGRSTLSEADDPEALIKAIAQEFNSLYIVVDGLDEVSDPDATITTLRELTKTTHNIKTVLLSREIFEIMSVSMESYPIIKLDGLNTSEDVNRFIQSRLDDIKRKDPSKEFPPEVFNQISQKANGMFLWAKLMMDSLKTAYSVEDALEIVSSTPEKLDEFYNQIMMRLIVGPRLNNRMRSLARRVIMLMCAASRPLRWTELVCMLNTHEEGVKPIRMFQSTILDTCSPLIEQQPGTDVVRFVHLSVREFFLKLDSTNLEIKTTGFHFLETDTHLEAAKICLNYLLDPKSDDKWRSVLTTGTEIPSLQEYASKFWGTHVIRSIYDESLSAKMHIYLSDQSRRMTWIASQLFRESSGFPLQHLIKIQKQLHNWDSGNKYASDQLKKERLDWIQDVGRVLVDIDSADVNAKDLASGKSRITYFEKLMVIRDLSREYTIRQRLEEGEKWMQEALQKRQDKYGEEHISTVWLLNSLGIIYDQQHKVELSAETHEKALKIQEKTWGTRHLETVWTINELGRVYRHLGRYDDAVNMHLKAYEVLKVLDPNNHLQLAWTLNTLARAYRKQGSTDKSLECHREAIDYQKLPLGEEHPHVLWAIADIGRCYRDKHELERSAHYHRQCLEGRKKVLGSDHADTLWAMNDLGLVLSEDGHTEEARKLHEAALEGQRRLLGENHPHTVWSRKQIESLNTR
ncbi:hypothetical protein TWF718_011128 [Orbilia javanica]|uniref:NACHT domain-containing protein n=1 Tax=Orbilia javanica TaxID=47235 RepID=A0AAN8NNF6_9PEZI